MDPSDAAFYYKNDVIPVPQQSMRQTRNVRVLLDSRFRDLARYPQSNSFTIELTYPIEKVYSAKLVNYNVPISTNMISKSNNVLQFTEQVLRFEADGTIVPFDPASIVTITIPSGNYQPADLALQLQNLMNASSKATITVTYDPISQQFAFRSDLTNKTTLLENLGLSLLFIVPNSCARIVGFYDNTTYYGAVPEPVTVYYNNNIVALSGSFDQLAVGDRVVLSDGTNTQTNVIAFVDATNRYVQLRNLATGNLFNGSLNHGKIAAPAKFMPMQVVTNDYIILEIDPLGSNMQAVDQPVDRAFAVLSPGFATTQLVAPYERRFHPPINSIPRFRLRFKNFDGQLCDFENNENYVELLLTIERHPNMN